MGEVAEMMPVDGTGSHSIRRPAGSRCRSGPGHRKLFDEGPYGTLVRDEG